MQISSIFLPLWLPIQPRVVVAFQPLLPIWPVSSFLSFRLQMDSDGLYHHRCHHCQPLDVMLMAVERCDVDYVLFVPDVELTNHLLRHEEYDVMVLHLIKRNLFSIQHQGSTRLRIDTILYLTIHFLKS